VIHIRRTFIVVTAVLFEVARCSQSYADSKAVLRQGLLGAGTGAVATAISGAKGDDIWKGALAGAGVNVVGGALFDVLTGEQTGAVSGVQRTVPARHAVEPVRVRSVRTVQQESPFAQAYREGFENGYCQGYDQGYRDALANLSRRYQ